MNVSSTLQFVVGDDILLAKHDGQKFIHATLALLMDDVKFGFIDT